MPVDLLQELEATVSLPPPTTPEVLEPSLALMGAVIREMRSQVEHARGSIELFQHTWNGLVSAVAAGKTDEVHQVRDRFVRAVQHRIDLLKVVQNRLVLLQSMGISLPDSAVLQSELEGMEQFRSRVCDPWQSAEDLEDLAARDYPLTTEHLDRVGPKFSPPASWYAEEGKPS